MNRTNVLKSLFALVVMIAVLSACNKEEVVELNNPETTAGSDLISKLTDLEVMPSGDADDASQKDDCFTFNYPITIVEPDGTETEIADDAGLDNFLETYYRGNGDEDDLTLNYPVEVTLEDGSIEAINNDDELDELLEDCFEKYEEDYEDGFEDDFFEDCFELLYPVTVVFPDGSIQLANSDDDIEMIEDTFYRDAANDDEDLTFNYPITIIWEDGEEEVINNDDEFEEAFEACDEHDCDDDGRGGDRDGHHGGDRGDHDKERCFEVIFPITVMLADGTEATVDSRRDLHHLVKGLDDDDGEDGRGEDDDDEKPFTIVFPIEVMLEDESIATIDSEEGFEALKESCED